LSDNGRVFGSTTNALSIAPCNFSDVGVYACTAMNEWGARDSSPATLTVIAPCPGDANADTRIDMVDFAAVLKSWGDSYLPNPGGPGDANGDGVVDFGDILCVLANYGHPCQ